MNFPNFDPTIFSIGPLQVRWYGLMYVIGFLLAGHLLKKLVERDFLKVSVEKIDSLITHMLVCMFLGARIFYVFIYNWDYYSDNLGELLSVWKGGLSFHGALVGLIVGGIIFARKNKVPWLQVMDSVGLAGCPGLFFGRMGNFINGELYGRITDSPLGVIFPGGGPYPRHASQLYEAILEGIVLSILLWAVSRRVRIYGLISAYFLIGYGSFRYFIEFFREPDKQLGYFLGGTTTMGQILCLVMIAGGVFLISVVRKKPDTI